jgi:ribosome-associated protein
LRSTEASNQRPEDIVPDDLPINDRLVIPGSYLNISFTRSGGAGGQHVNTSDTSVLLRFKLAACENLRPGVKQRIQEARPSMITQEGELLLRADRRRSQKMNIDDARQRLADLIRTHLHPPKKRRPTKPTRSSKRRRVDNKKRRGSVKQGRGKVSRDD